MFEREASKCKQNLCNYTRDHWAENEVCTSMLSLSSVSMLWYLCNPPRMHLTRFRACFPGTTRLKRRKPALTVRSDCSTWACSSTNPVETLLYLPSSKILCAHLWVADEAVRNLKVRFAFEPQSFFKERMSSAAPPFTQDWCALSPRESPMGHCL